ncbi:crotonase/enoyl-CoA hydratase family protein [uncultured Abyssibacter sp.]|uniref:crotonase/enoyl-CoA hydratase family protein n=1 Tax=uncultured Abyssibacter sp. TaxID=2320202 RepID=UPI0032B112D9
MSERVIIDRQGEIAHVRLNRPEKHNGMDFAMLKAVIKAGRSLAKDRDLRAVLLSGNGPSFCAGLDVKSMFADPKRMAHGMAALHSPVTNMFQQWGMVWRALPVPVIACIHGNCFGAGIQLALAADIRITTPDAKLSIMEAKWGLVPDMSGMVTLRELLPADVAKELTFTGRVLSGEQAGELGLVTHVTADPEAKANELIAEMLVRSPDAIAAGKALIHDAWLADEGETLAAERRWQRKLMGRKNQRIAAKRNTEMAKSETGEATTPYEPRKLG